MTNYYGEKPELIAGYGINLPEYMSIVYLPVCMGDKKDIRLPENLECLRPMIYSAINHGKYKLGQKIYVSAKRGFASPDNPLNRPGWHADGFGTNDYNFFWYDKYPTLVSTIRFQNIEPNDFVSIEQFTNQIKESGVDPIELPTYALYAISPYVVHHTPVIPPPGGERQFVKITFSYEKYDLEGNAHNYLFDYSWEMTKRSTVRNNTATSEYDSTTREYSACLKT